MRKLNWGGHQFRRLVAGVAKHQSLITSASCIYSHRDIRRFRINGHNHAAGLRIETVFGPGVSNFLNGLASDLAIINLSRRGYLSANQDQSGHNHSFASDPASGVLPKDLVQNGV